MSSHSGVSIHLIIRLAKHADYYAARGLDASPPILTTNSSPRSTSDAPSCLLSGTRSPSVTSSS
jgi:hypothetical protein